VKPAAKAASHRLDGAEAAAASHDLDRSVARLQLQAGSLDA
jgi:hypothetical protein